MLSKGVIISVLTCKCLSDLDTFSQATKLGGNKNAFSPPFFLSSEPYSAPRQLYALLLIPICSIMMQCI